MKEYGLNKVHIIGIHIAITNAISQLDYGPVSNDKDNWMTFTKCWCHYTVHSTEAQTTSNIQTSMNLAFANSNKEEVIYHLTVKEIIQAQQDDPNLQALAHCYQKSSCGYSCESPTINVTIGTYS